jgi:deoxyribonuclease-2
VEALKMEKISTSPFHRKVQLKSRNGETFTSFAKSSGFNKELYEDFVAPFFNAGSFYVESWRHGPGNIASDCTKPTKVFNIQDISIAAGRKLEFSTLHDHSKWMVSMQNELICVGDINRQEHQKKRGGGTVCIQNQGIAKIYMDSVKDSESCKKNLKKKLIFF